MDKTYRDTLLLTERVKKKALGKFAARNNAHFLKERNSFTGREAAMMTMGKRSILSLLLGHTHILNV